MTNKTFSGLPAAASLTGAEIVPLTQSAASVKTTLAAIKTFFGVGGKVSVAIGNGSAASFTIVHNFNTRDVFVDVYRNATPWDSVVVDIARPDVNTVVISGFGVSPSAGQFQAVVRS